MSLLGLLTQLQADAVRVKAERPKRMARQVGRTPIGDEVCQSDLMLDHSLGISEAMGRAGRVHLFEEGGTGHYG